MSKVPKENHLGEERIASDPEKRKIARGKRLIKKESFTAVLTWVRAQALC